MKMSIRKVLPAVAAVSLSTVASADACQVCFSGADANTGAAMNGAIFLMLGMLAAVFTGIGAVTYGIWRRRHLAPLGPTPPFATGGHA